MSGEVRIHFVPEMRLRDLLKRGVDWVKEELKQEENSQMIQREIMEPLIQQFLQKIYPQLIVSSVAFLLVFIAVITILVLLFQIPGFSRSSSTMLKTTASVLPDPETILKGV